MKYSISDLEQLSGVQTHTIRIWERRYHALQPMRSPGNTRFYDDHQLRRLLNIVGISQSGLKISQVCALSDSEIDGLLKQEIDHTVSIDARFEYYISQLLNYGMVYDEFKVDQLISKCICDFGMSDAYKHVIYPLLVRLGLMWRRDSICPAQEHFLSNLIRQKLFAAINELPRTELTTSSWLLFLPEDEDHDISLLFASYMLRLSGHKVIYLGGKVPLEALKEAIVCNRPENMLLFMIRSRPAGHANEYLKMLVTNFQGTNIHLAGNRKLIAELELKSEINWIKTIEEFELTLNTVGHVH